jgi:putative ATP-dependent endonuclease of OLD family
MKIKSFSVKNYRSIAQSEKIALSDMTVLIGPNNEGKSNILNALVCAMGLIERHSKEDKLINLVRQDRPYIWERDFPVGLQKTKINGNTTF